MNIKKMKKLMYLMKCKKIINNDTFLIHVDMYVPGNTEKSAYINTYQ